LSKYVDSTTRSSAIAALGNIPNQETTQKLIEALDDEDPRVQANAIEALESANPPDLIELIEDKLNSPNNRIKANAIKVILKPQYSLALKALAAMLDHPDPVYRRSALWAVSHTMPLYLISKINKLANEDPDPEIKDSAKHAVSGLAKIWKLSETENQKNQPEESLVN
jgi:HEAT repeat protein